MTYRWTNRITPTATGCTARLACKLFLPLPGWLSRRVGRLMFTKAAHMDRSAARLRELLEGDVAATAESEEVQGVPAVV